jgi:alpha-glucosidase (family GH31 glycosyl hydrolase)
MSKLSICLVLILITVFEAKAQVKQSGDTSFIRLSGEGWWGGVVNDGVKMPLGETSYSFNLFGNDAGNQSVPLLISSKGRYVWSDEPFQFSFRNDSIIIQKTNGPVKSGRSGNTLKESYMSASRQFFPTSGLWPDSLLVTAPQYNLWIELMYDPNQKDVLNYAKQVLANGMPAGVLMIDDNWSNYYGHFDFDREKFPDAKVLIDELHRLGFKVMLWICPFISPDSPAYRELQSKKLLLLDNQGRKGATWNNSSKPLLLSWWNGYSACLDLSNPDAGKWLKSKLDFLQTTYGVDGYKLDAGDAQYYTSPNLVSFKTEIPNEHSIFWAEVGLHYPLNEYRAMWKMGGQPLVERLRDKRHNWPDLQSLVPNTIAQQLAGHTFTCPDMIGGGSFGSFLPGRKIDQKLIVRSAQCHALMPMMQFSAAPWRILDSTHLNAVKKIVRTRQENLPYLMQVMRNSAKTGEPALRPLEYDFPGQGFLKVNDQFMLGDRMMVVPVVTASDTRDVIIPKGTWKYNNTTIKGPVTKTINVPLDELPIFIKIK